MRFETSEASGEALSWLDCVLVLRIMAGLVEERQECTAHGDRYDLLPPDHSVLCYNDRDPGKVSRRYGYDIDLDVGGSVKHIANGEVGRQGRTKSCQGEMLQSAGCSLFGTERG